MAKSSIVSVCMLDDGYILTPERYDARKLDSSNSGVRVDSLCNVVKNTLTPKKASPDLKYLVLDTGDVKDGFISFKDAVGSESIGSTKKILQAGDVIISRLRPYLRQVGYVDIELFKALPEDTMILCSTEFFILRSDQDISFLAAVLLSQEPQEILNVSQEGGHHPRFNQKTLETIRISEKLLNTRDSVSKNIKTAIKGLRAGEQGILGLLNDLDA